MSAIPYFIVDAFSKKRFGGNPAAVCILTETKNDEWLQKVAAEFNLSETAFLWHKINNQWQLRWFTPVNEVNLCGHATLASAHVLANEFALPDQKFIFSTHSGDLFAEIKTTDIQLEFPKVQPKYLSKIHAHDIGLDQLGLQPTDYFQAGEDILLILATEQEVLAYEPQLEQIAKVNARGLIITAASDNNKRDFVSRFFAPSIGVNEDPVTGSAHCSLAVYWSRQLGKLNLSAEQLSERRGTLKMQVNTESVYLMGQSVTFAKGNIPNP